MPSKIAWHHLEAKTVLAEVVQALLALALLAAGWLTFPLLYALAGVEVTLVVLLSGIVYRQRSAWRIAVDTLKSLFVWAFCGVFVFAVYFGVGGFKDGIDLSPRAFALLAGLAAVRLGWAAIEAHTTADPRLQWTREVSMRGAVLALTMFFAAFACFIPGLPLAMLLAHVAPAVAPDLGLGLAFIGVQTVLAFVVATMTPAELAEISRQPYLPDSSRRAH